MTRYYADEKSVEEIVAFVKRVRNRAFYIGAAVGVVGSWVGMLLGWWVL